VDNLKARIEALVVHNKQLLHAFNVARESSDTWRDLYTGLIREIEQILAR
jgi:hypothetical protein